jgi:hypothetical protein
MLYVDDDNVAGKGLYKTLGFAWWKKQPVPITQAPWAWNILNVPDS